MPDDAWTVVASFSEPLSAEALAGRLTNENVPSQVSSNQTLPGLVSEFAVLVPSELLHRARWVLEQAKFSDQELTYLATGELPKDGEV